MTIVRGLISLGSLLITMAVSKFLNLDFVALAAAIAFMLSIDTVVVRYATYLYMKEVMENMSKEGNDEHNPRS